MRAPPAYGVVLAGGKAQRMGGADKGGVLLAGKRLFDHVYERLAPQVGGVLVSGDHDYGAGLVVIPDHGDGPEGPAAGLFSVTRWLMTHAPHTDGFLTAPVDAPFLPQGLARRLTAQPGSAVVSCAGQIHPTFAYWELATLHAYFEGVDMARAPALKRIAAALSARKVSFEEEAAVANINTPEELKAAEATLARKG